MSALLRNNIMVKHHNMANNILSSNMVVHLQVHRNFHQAGRSNGMRRVKGGIMLSKLQVSLDNVFFKPLPHSSVPKALSFN